MRLSNLSLFSSNLLKEKKKKETGTTDFDHTGSDQSDFSNLEGNTEVLYTYPCYLLCIFTRNCELSGYRLPKYITLSFTNLLIMID